LSGSKARDFLPGRFLERVAGVLTRSRLRHTESYGVDGEAAVDIAADSAEGDTLRLGANGDVTVASGLGNVTLEGESPKVVTRSSLGLTVQNVYGDPAPIAIGPATASNHAVTRVQLDAKQDQLTAGANITITGGTISAAGAQGPQGAQGVQGPQGVKGDKGDPGEPGGGGGLPGIITDPNDVSDGPKIYADNGGLVLEVLQGSGDQYPKCIIRIDANDITFSCNDGGTTQQVTLSSLLAFGNEDWATIGNLGEHLNEIERRLNDGGIY
jgi:hypothetical protein